MSDMKRCWFCFLWFPLPDLVDYTLVGDENETVKVCARCKARRMAMRGGARLTASTVRGEK